MSLMIGGVNAAFIGVNDLSAQLDLYVGQLGWLPSDEGVIPADQAVALWGEGMGEVPFTVLTAAGSPHGRIILVQVTSQDARPHPKQADTGFIAVNIYTRDIDVSYRELSAAGYTWVTPPATWEVPLGTKLVAVTQGFLEAPESTDIVFVEPAQARGTTAWETDPQRHYTELSSVVCHVPDFDSEAYFWGPEGLGLDSWYDVSFTHPGLDKMAGFPAGTMMRLSFLAGSTTSRIEVTHLADRSLGADQRAWQRTGRHLGHTGWLIEVVDIEAARARVVECGGVVHSGPHQGSQALFGGRSVMFIDTPNGLPMTLVEAG